MRWLATVAVVVVSAWMAPTTASGQYTFGDWASDQGYSSGDVMPFAVDANGSSPAIDSLNGIGEFDWTTTPTTELGLYGNQLSSIESDAFSGLTNLMWLWLARNELSNIESDAFSGLTNLTRLYLSNNMALTELDLANADFSNLARFDVEGNANISSVSLRNTVVNQTALAALLDGGGEWIGIGELDGITEMDLSGVDFGSITELEPLYAMNDLTDLWLVAPKNLDASDLDLLLDNLATIEGTSTEASCIFRRRTSMRSTPPAVGYWPRGMPSEGTTSSIYCSAT